MDAKQMIASGGKLVGRVGLQSRPVIEFGGKLYEQAINFDDGNSHSEMYEVSEQRATELRAMLGG